MNYEQYERRSLAKSGKRNLKRLGTEEKMKKIGKAGKNKKTDMAAGKLKGLQAFLKEEEGMGTVEIILIIVVLIGLVIIFKTQLRALVETVFEKITKDSNTVMS